MKKIVSLVLLSAIYFTSGCATPKQILYYNIDASKHNQYDFEIDKGYCQAYAIERVQLPEKYVAQQNNTQGTTTTGTIRDQYGNVYRTTQTTQSNTGGLLGNPIGEIQKQSDSNARYYEAVQARNGLMIKCMRDLGWYPEQQ